MHAAKPGLLLGVCIGVTRHACNPHVDHARTRFLKCEINVSIIIQVARFRDVQVLKCAFHSRECTHNYIYEPFINLHARLKGYSIIGIQTLVDRSDKPRTTYSF